MNFNGSNNSNHETITSSSSTTSTVSEAAMVSSSSDNNNNNVMNMNMNINMNMNSNMNIIPDIIIPGPFVVLQGNVGDGISNTIDGLPYPILTTRSSSRSSSSRFSRSSSGRSAAAGRGRGRQQRSRQNTSQREEGDDDDSYHHVPRTTTAATVAAGSLFATVVAPAPVVVVATATATSTTTSTTNNNNNNNTNTDYVVVNEDDDDDNEQRQQQQQQQQQQLQQRQPRHQPQPHQPTEISSSEDRISIEIWKNTRRRIELQQRRDWKESLQQNVPEYLLHNHIMMKNTNNTSNSNNNTTWWEKNGKIVVLRELPTKLRGGDNNNNGPTVHVPSIIGLLCPGSTIHALDLIELNSNTLLPVQHHQPQHVRQQRRQQRQRQHEHQNQNQYPHAQQRIYSHGRLGIIQMIKLETKEGRIGYTPINLDGYPLLSPGIPNQYNMKLSNDSSSSSSLPRQQHTSSSSWIWRITCPSGAYLRDGLDLNTNHIYTIPYGSYIAVSKRCINNQGLSRIQTSAIIVYDDNSNNNNNNDGDDDDDQQPIPRHRVINGWCSELLNPLSGQRGIIAQPLPYCVPAIYRVTLPIGAVIRKDIELSSPQIGIAAYGTLIKVCKRGFSEHPVQNCIERLQLVGNQGWISIRLNRLPPNDDLIVEYVSNSTDDNNNTDENNDNNFDPDNPGIYHLNEQRQYQQRQVESEFESEIESHSIQRRQRRRDDERGDDLSSVDESYDNNDDYPANVDDYDGLNNNNNETNSNSNNNHDNNNNNNNHDSRTTSYCVVCLTSECNATIVHGSTGHIVCCLICARILKARGDNCPVCRLNIDLVIQHFYA